MIWIALFFTLFIAAASIVIVGSAVRYLTVETDDNDAILVIDWHWFLKGFTLPVALWFLMNIGLSFHLQPFMPAIQAAQYSGGNWLNPFIHTMNSGLLVISSYWGAFTLAWTVLNVRRGLREDLKMEFHGVCFTAIAIMILPSAFLLYVGHGWVLGWAIMILCAPIAYYAAPIIRKPPKAPGYARAVARMKFGKYAQAEAEILKQLETAENDFDGWMMLAELHATRFKELREAEQIVLDVCLQPDIAPSQISVALHKLADWQINVASDTEAAARSLDLISDRLPGTHLAYMAEMRRRQLPQTNAEYREQQEVRPVPLPVISGDALEKIVADRKSADTQSTVALVNQLSEALTRNPQNISDREKLARLLAEPLGKAELAVEQIELLLGMGNQPDVKRVEWLTLIAGWQLQLLNDETAAMETLAKIIADFPNTPQAFAAQRRLNLIKADITARKV
jgi:tetratricopeptide (TPR) repeat protein